MIFLGEKSEMVYYFTGLTGVQRPGGVVPGRILSPLDGTAASVRLTDLYGGLYSGVAWTWSGRKSTLDNDPAT
ncbi:hypothetical protein ACTXMG_07870 [Corynebacterium flavescens]|uniref:hypothetical protein n=1 Tax=Corynebacterium flavescens TaxID=28028 RepID=UPI003FCF3855